MVRRPEKMLVFCLKLYVHSLGMGVILSYCQQCLNQDGKCQRHTKPLSIQMTSVQRAKCLGAIAALDPPPYNDQKFVTWCKEAILYPLVAEKKEVAASSRTRGADYTEVEVWIYEFVSCDVHLKHSNSSNCRTTSLLSKSLHWVNLEGISYTLLSGSPLF